MPVTQALVLAALLAAACVPVHADGQASPLAWINSVRRAAGAQPAGPDAVLSATAQAWAGVLAASGLLSHRGADGSSVLDRYRSQGGTEAHVGEIIGAGRDLAAIEEGWMASPDHRKLAASASWTHAGWGSAPSGASTVWVILFCEKLVQGLRLEASGDGMVVSGSFVPRGAVRALLYAGLDLLEPAEWDLASRQFSFAVPRNQETGYFRLGYLSAGGAFRLTNAFTLLPGTESPGEPARFEAPARSP